MHAISATAPGAPDALEYTSAPGLEPGPGQVLVRVAAAGVNFIDTYLRSGVYPIAFPFTPGSEGAGEVIVAGAGVGSPAAGDRVAWASSVTGSYASHVLLDADQTLPVPDGIDLLVAAALPLQGMTAHMLVDGVTQLTEGDAVFVTAGSGGVGQLFIQLAVAAGARVFTMVGSAEKVDLAAAAGAEHVFVQSDFDDLTAELPAALRELTDGSGVDVFYDGLGKVTFDAAVASVRRRGLIVLFGGASGQVPPFDLQRLNAAGSLFVTRPTLAHYTTDPAERARRWSAVTGAVSAGGLSVKIGAQFPLADAADAHTALESRATTGKVVLIP